MESEEKLVNCLVCASPTKRFHFRVASCRACAVFFRRTINLKKEYVCELGAKKCDLLGTNGTKPSCRYCRFEKCKNIGMKFEPEDKDSLEKSTKNESTQTDTYKSFDLTAIGHIVNEPPTYNQFQYQGSEKFIYNFNPIINQVKGILTKNDIILPIDSSISFMEEMTLVFSTFLNKLKPENTDVTPFFDREMFIKFHAKYWIELAKLLTSSSIFDSLGCADKILLYDNLRGIFMEIVLSYLSVTLFGFETSDIRVATDNGTVCDFSNSELRIRGAKTNNVEKYARIWKPIAERKIKHILIPMKIMKINKFEALYLLSAILWDVQDIKNLSSEALNVAEQNLRLTEEVLHSFYTNKMNITNYANRLGTLHRIILSGRRYHQENHEMQTMAKIFNLFEIDVYNAELL